MKKISDRQKIRNLLKLQAENKVLEAALRRNITDYKTRHDKAVEGLVQLTQGLGQVPGPFCDKDPSWDHSMKRLAGNILKKIAVLPLREAP